MAESPRTAQNVDYIMNDTENIRHYLKILAEKENSVESKTAQAEMLMAIDRSVGSRHRWSTFNLLLYRQ
ncbi:MAG: hypothetical protein LC775_06505 [Acidobacteria bacterium]|nr:hypothetical protein [Acidobacteriota bacterium]